MKGHESSLSFYKFVKDSVNSVRNERQTESRGGLTFTYVNKPEFEAVYNEVFVDQEYGPFRTTSPSPRILDCGAHIGLATLFFKQKYPAARISAIEPDPLNFMLLMLNSRQNELKDVDLHSCAVGVKRETLPFYVEQSKSEDTPRWTWGNSVVRNQWTDELPHVSFPVPSVPLSDFLDEPIDLLKLDIEGYEGDVLEGVCKDGSIANVREIAMDFHGGSPSNQENTPERITELLEKNGFEHTIFQDGNPRAIDDITRTIPYWLIIHARRGQN